MSNNALCAAFIVIVCLSSNRVEEDFKEPLSYRRQSNRKAEEELHHISEKLSNRLEELDQVSVLFSLFTATCHTFYNLQKMY